MNAKVWMSTIRVTRCSLCFRKQSARRSGGYCEPLTSSVFSLLLMRCPQQRRLQWSWTTRAFWPRAYIVGWLHCRLVETRAKWPWRKRNSQGRDPRTREAKQPGTGPQNPWTKKSSANSRRSFHNATRGNETRGEERNTVLQVRKQRQLGEQVCPGWVECDHQRRPEGKLSQSEAENFRAEVRKDKAKVKYWSQSTSNIRKAGESNTLQVEPRSERMILTPELTATLKATSWCCRWMTQWKLSRNVRVREWWDILEWRYVWREVDWSTQKW